MTNSDHKGFLIHEYFASCNMQKSHGKKAYGNKVLFMMNLCISFSCLQSGKQKTSLESSIIVKDFATFYPILFFKTLRPLTL